MRFKYKISLFLLAASGFLISAAAQITGGSEIFGGGDFSSLLLGLIDAITLVQIDTIAGAAIFVALTAVFYFAEKNMFEQIFLRLEEIIVDAMGGDSIRGTRRNGKDVYPTGVKGMALATAFITSNMLAAWLGVGVLWVVMPIAILGLLIVLVVKGKIFASVLPTQSAVSAGKKGGSKASDKIRDYLSSVEDEEEDLKEKEDQTESEESDPENADPHKIAGEMKDQVNELEDIVSKIESIESNMETVLSEDKEEEDYVIREEKKEESELEDVQNIEKQVFTDFQEFLNQIKQFKNSGGPPPREWHMDVDEKIARDLEAQLEQLEEFEEVLKFEKDIHEHIDSLQIQLRGLKQNLDTLTKEIQQLEQLEKELEDEEAKAEKIAKHFNDEADWETIKKEEEETKKVIEEIEKILQEKNRIGQRLEEEIDQLQKEKKYEKQEIQEIQKIIQELNEEESVIVQIENGLNEWANDPRNNMSPKEKEMLEHLEKLKESIDKVEKEAEDLMNAL